MQGLLQNDRTNFSKNKLLFPTFIIDGPPMWVMAMSMTCNKCRHHVNDNAGEVLCTLPAYARNAYPVETKYATNKNSHLCISATSVFDLLMPTCGNGDLCSRILYNAMNRSYLERVEDYYSLQSSKKNTSEKEVPSKCVELHNDYVRACPPTGDGIRDAYDEASSSSNTPWKLSDHDRHVREIQNVKCKSIFAQDHTHKVTDNYYQKKTLGAFALWDCANENGEIAFAVLVPSTKTIDFAHVATALSKRRGFKPLATYSDTWPAKSEFWSQLFDVIKGRLGLFHCIQRITRTLKKNHVDHYKAVIGLLNCIYHYNAEDHEKLLKALKEETLGSVKYSDDDISEIKSTKVFKQRYEKYLRKEICPANIMCGMLDDWFIVQFKCAATAGSRPAGGRKDPINGNTLFSTETKGAIEECKKKAVHLQDPLPLDQMYDIIHPSPNASHQLKECLSRRGKSCLELFHLMLAHFGNSGMRTTLADNLNLTGTARHNLSIRRKRLLIAVTPENTVNRTKTPAAYESVVEFYNHTELHHINRMAIQAGQTATNLPFQNVEMLPPDNGERFFSECLSWMRDAKPRYNLVNCRCLCSICGQGLSHQHNNPACSHK